MSNKLFEIVEKLEVELLKPEVRKSAKRISELLANDFVEFGMEGKKFTKKDMVKALPNSKNEKYEKYKATNFKAKKIAPNTVLLTYRASIENTRKKTKIWTLRCSIWQKRKNNWQMIFHQGTPEI
jgi:hypothetical protein